MKKYSGIFWLIGLCAFIAFMCSGFIWLLGVMKVQWSLLSTIKYVANLVLTFAAFLAGWIWLSSIKNQTLRTVLQVLFVIFAVLSVCGVFGLGI